MARAVKRSGTANHQFTKRIPADVIRILDGLPAAYRPKGWGRNVISFTLGTADNRRAAAEHARASAEVEDRFAALRAGVRHLTLKEAVALSGRIYAALSAGFEDDPGTAASWLRSAEMIDSWQRWRSSPGFPSASERASRRASASALVDLDAQYAARFPEPAGSAEEGANRAANLILEHQAEQTMAAEGIIVDLESWDLVVAQVAKAAADAFSKLARNADGDYRPDSAAGRFPKWEPTTAAASATGKAKLTLAALFDRRADHPEQGPVSRRTKVRYRGVFGAVATFLNNPDARTLSTDDLTRYVDARMKDDGPGRLLPKVARDVHKAALSSVYGWAKGKRIVPSNPAEGVSIKVARVPRLRRPEASDAEVAELMRAVLALPPDAPAGTLDAAKRWAVLIALYTGCRIGEATQLRKEDIATAGKLPMIRITPEAGDVKDKEARSVPVHGRLADLGLLAFVDAAPAGPLFYGTAERRKADAATPPYELVAKDVAAWSREHGLGDPLLKRPMHSLRHRFTAVARAAGMEGQYMRAITGHESGDQSERYGSFDAATLHREIARLRPEVVEGRPRDGSASLEPLV